MSQGRRVIYVGLAEDVARIAATSTPQPPSTTSWDNGISPLAGLLMVEIRRIERWTRMTDLQASVLEWNLKGLTPADIAEIKGTTPHAIEAVLSCARKKCMTYPNRGLLTVLVEECGWEAVTEFLAEQYGSDP